LHGVTSSGKTEIYTSLIPSLLEQGKQVLYMLPEIALTTQIIRRLQQSLGGYVCVYHSRFNANERVEIWNRVKSGEPIVVLGARSALMLPFHQLELIICDEEHDASYKQQDPAPRYHARDAAIYLAQLCGARVLLGSATPSLESYTNALQKKFGLVTLRERFNQVELPPIQIIDNRKTEKSSQEDRIITQALRTAITDKLSKGEQVILFQNRRGYDPYQICLTCGWIPGCRDCNVSLTFHKFKHRLICHYCGQQYAPVTVCNACGMHDFSTRNFGTEKIEEIVSQLFPQARIARMDQDAVKGKHQHDNLIQQFEQHQLDILIGTQMVVKGLHFDKVNLVGILDADALLQFADFRVNERAFQLIEQVSGRAGRTAGEGMVLVQAGQIHHPVLTYAQQHDYVGLYQDELPKRKEFGYPPFTRLIRFYCKHREDNLAGEAARHLHSLLQQLPGCRVLDPAQPPVNRVRNQYIWELLLKIPREGVALGKIKHAISRAMQAVQSNQRFSRVRIYADVDPI
jgi:primosomal protein N' (replication factor Y)